MFEEILSKDVKISVIGLGYVGLPLAVEFARKLDVIGFDINEQKVEKYRQGHDITKEVGDEELRKSQVFFTSNCEDLKKAKFHIVAVPTPIGKNNIPDLRPIEGASKILGQNLTRGSIIVYESTVYPGVTEEVCVPILEEESGLKCGIDFKVGYSPERINPGDRVHTVDKIVKIVSGWDGECLEIIAKIYELIVAAGVYRASSIKVAEAAKVIENSQRDLNIAFMNELSIIFNKMGIDTKEVIEAAATKWNFLKFYPGLVGGHCIGVDPYYLTYRAQELGYHPEVILAGRRINDNMGKYVAENTVKHLIKANCQIKGAKVLIMGITFKENVPDVRNTKVIDIIKELNEYGVQVYVTDPIACSEEVKEEYGLEMTPLSEIEEVDAIIMAVAHEEYKKINLVDLRDYFANKHPIIIDVKWILDEKKAKSLGYLYWRL